MSPVVCSYEQFQPEMEQARGACNKLKMAPRELISTQAHSRPCATIFSVIKLIILLTFLITDCEVFTPNDGDNWLLAKLSVQAADSAISQISEHLVKIHILMEPVCVSLKRHFSVQHPVHEVLKFHCREIIVPNTFGIITLVGENEFTHKLFPFGHLGALEIIRRMHPVITWDVTDFRKNLRVCWSDL